MEFFDNKNMLTIFILSFMMISSISKPTFNVGLKIGGWVEYDSWFYQRKINYTSTEEFDRIYINDYNYTTTIRILNVSYSSITFQEVRRRLGSIYFNERITADPTILNEGPPEYKVHVFFIPPNLEPGDKVLYPLEWIELVINETVEKTCVGVKRQINHIDIYKTRRGTTDGEWVEIKEIDAYFDKDTGLMVEYFSNYTKTYYTSDNNIDSNGFKLHVSKTAK